MAGKIAIRGARTHNLNNINLDIPRDKLVVFTGLSGSGKSSLVFDTIYAEGQRRYVESLSAYARQFLSLMQRPEVDLIEGLSPAVAIEQKSTSRNPRSTVGTVTEIYDYLRLLYARIGDARCPDHGIDLKGSTVTQITDSILSNDENQRMALLAPVVRGQKGTHETLFANLRGAGFGRVRINGVIYDIEDLPSLPKTYRHDIEVVVDRFRPRENIRSRLVDSIDTALNLTGGLIATIILVDGAKDRPTPDVKTSALHEKNLQSNLEKFQLYSTLNSCAICGYTVGVLEPKIFSFNNPMGACESCEGLGKLRVVDPDRVVTDRNLSLTEGAIQSWGPNIRYLFNRLECVASHYDIDLNTAWKDYPESTKDLFLHGSTGEKINFSYITEAGRTYRTKRAWRGIIASLEKRYAETSSEKVRESLNEMMSFEVCSTCEGSRLRLEARHVFVTEKSLPAVTSMSVADAREHFENLELFGARAEIGVRLLAEIRSRLGFLCDVGLDYLTLERSAETLSGGEAQRIRLASQVSTGLVGVLYILDEPSIGLHQRDNARLLSTLTRLRDLGNTVLVVEHDEEAIRAADHLVDIGVGAGIHGGDVVAQGQVQDIIDSKSLTGEYLSHKKVIPVPSLRRQARNGLINLKGASGNNLKGVDVTVPIGTFTCVTGVSGSGKSTLINHTLWPVIAREVGSSLSQKAQPYKSLDGVELLDKAVVIDQSPIGRTPRSNPATYTGLFSPIRDIFAQTNESKARGYAPGRFSFNVAGGRCEACKGDGVMKIEMHFLADVYVPCDSCKGKRYRPETLEIYYKGKNIHDVLEMSVETALEFFSAIPSVRDKLQTLADVGLTYIKLGQPATTLSGGEAQRIKLSRELAKRATGSTFYVLDEPTTGLHFHDISMLLKVLHRLVDKGNTVVVIEHNLDVIKTADWLIDLGPEGGDGGGTLLFQGTPEDLISKCKKSYTAQFLKNHIAHLSRNIAPKKMASRKQKTKVA